MLGNQCHVTETVILLHPVEVIHPWDFEHIISEPESNSPVIGGDQQTKVHPSTEAVFHDTLSLIPQQISHCVVLYNVPQLHGDAETGSEVTNQAFSEPTSGLSALRPGLFFVLMISRTALSSNSVS